MITLGFCNNKSRDAVRKIDYQTKLVSRLPGLKVFHKVIVDLTRYLRTARHSGIRAKHP